MTEQGREPDWEVWTDHADPVTGTVVHGKATRIIMRRSHLRADQAEDVAQVALAEASRTYDPDRGASFETYFAGPPGKPGLLGLRLFDYLEALKKTAALDAAATLAAEDVVTPLHGEVEVEYIPHPWKGFADLEARAEWRDGADFAVHPIQVSPPEEVREMFEFRMRDGLTMDEALRLEAADAGVPLKAIARRYGVAVAVVRRSIVSARKKREAGVDKPHAWVDAAHAPQWWCDGFNSDPALMRPRDRKRAIAARDAALAAAAEAATRA